MNRIIVPPESPTQLEGPVVFLAGPIQGAADWQAEAIKYLQQRPERLVIASPRRSNESWKFQYEIQVDWETRWLEIAAQQGVILFWCAKEREHLCERAYAQTTRVEMGEWVLGNKPCRLALGFEEGYTGTRYVKHRLQTSNRPELRNLKVFESLKDTCDEAVRLLPRWVPHESGK